MKKLFILLIISAIGFFACNNEANDTKVGEDSSVAEPVTGNPPTNPTDTMQNIDTTSQSATDTAIH